MRYLPLLAVLVFVSGCRAPSDSPAVAESPDAPAVAPSGSEPIQGESAGEPVAAEPSYTKPVEGQKDVGEYLSFLSTIEQRRAKLAEEQTAMVKEEVSQLASSGQPMGTRDAQNIAAKLHSGQDEWAKLMQELHSRKPPEGAEEVKALFGQYLQHTWNMLQRLTYIVEQAPNDTKHALHQLQREEKMAPDLEALAKKLDAEIDKARARYAVEIDLDVS